MIKIMSFNIRYGRATDGINHWQHRSPLVAARIQIFSPDLLGLQECLDNEQADFIRNALTDYSFYGIHRGGEGESALEMAPVLWKTSVFELLDKGYFWLNETGQAGRKGWDADYPRTCTWVKLLHLASNQTLIYLNTHFDYQPIAPQQSAKQLQNWLSKTIADQPLIITGDFNNDKTTPVFQQLTANECLLDAHQNHPPVGTFHEFGTRHDLEMLDWILYSKHFSVLEANVDLYHEGTLYPSDHYPITATLDWST